MNEEKRHLVLVGTNSFLESKQTLSQLRKKALQLCVLNNESMAICEVVSIASVSNNARFLDMTQVDLHHLP